MRTPTRVVLTTTSSLLLVAAWMGPAAADDTIVVEPGPNAIQQAVDAADPGDTIKIRPGTYEESVLVTKSLTIRGTDDVLIRPPATPPANACEGVAGFCVFGEFDAAGNVTKQVDDVRISRLDISGFPAFGVIAVGADDHKVSQVRADDNGEYGLGAFDSEDVTYTHNEASGNAEAGFYMGDSPDSENVVEDNVATDNGFGIFLRDSTDIKAEDNEVSHNCIGILALDTGAPTVAGDYRLRDNEVTENDRACAPNEEAPPLSGLGILLLGTQDVKVEDNKVLRNVPSGETIASAGIAVLSGALAGGADPEGNEVEDNKVLRNEEFDLLWDGSGTDNDFDDNRCETSSPDGLCD
ncbi:MAG: right-handed parallel beta-helix repeat-containing protein [Nocardioidaceae bacterium]